MTIRDPRIFSTFMFSESFELEILLAKLHSEAPLVEGWVAVENTYTLKGARKSLSLASHLAADTRFATFRDRVTIVELDADFTGELRIPIIEWLEHGARLMRQPANRERLRRAFAERPFFHAERAQRDAALAPLLDLAGGEAWVLVTDVDEMLDASDPTRADAVRAATSSGADVVALSRRRFVFDIDNEAVPRVRYVPLVSTASLAAPGASLDRLRKQASGLVAAPPALVYEYSSCFPVPAVARKLATFAHLDPGPDALAQALECNHALPLLTASRVVPEDWYARVDPEAAGAPHYVLDNLERLRTGSVNPEYREARRRRYPGLFGGRGR